MIINDSRINNKLKDNSIDKNNIKKAIVAFISGGLIGVLGQLLYYLFFFKVTTTLLNGSSPSL